MSHAAFQARPRSRRSAVNASASNSISASFMLDVWIGGGWLPRHRSPALAGGADDGAAGVGLAENRGEFVSGRRRGCRQWRVVGRAGSRLGRDPISRPPAKASGIRKPR
jgi:hypothetical protein